MTDRSLSTTVIEENGFLSWLGITVESETEGRAVLALPHRAELTNVGGDVIHGGVVATIIDNAAGSALRTVLETPETATYATTDLNVSYLRPATGDLRAEATVRRHGSSMAVIAVDVRARANDDEWTTVAVGRGTFFIGSDG